MRSADGHIFVYSEQPGISRGWKVDDVWAYLVGNGDICREAHVRTVSEAETLVRANPTSLFWPVCYTIGSDPHGPLITTLFERLQVPYVCANSAALTLSSKIAFKAALAAKTRVASPRTWHVYEDGTVDEDVQFPAVLKTEFSCNSEGVVVVNDASSLADAVARFNHQFGQPMFVERWERDREFTVAFLPPSYESRSAAALELRVHSSKCYIDVEAKSDNRLIDFSRPECGLCQELESMVMESARLLGIDGHFRMDIVRNNSGELFAIEVNFLPFLTRVPPNQSYFPMAFEFAGWTYESILKRMVSYAMTRAAGA